jgi:hypothetical protein
MPPTPEPDEDIEFDSQSFAQPRIDPYYVSDDLAKVSPVWEYSQALRELLERKPNNPSV